MVISVHQWREQTVLDLATEREGIEVFGEHSDEIELERHGREEENEEASGLHLVLHALPRREVQDREEGGDEKVGDDAPDIEHGVAAREEKLPAR